jgi:histidinol-phosphate phosphatase family protein
MVLSMKAVILAGGKGTRMGDFTKEISKPMLKVGNLPILEHQILLLRKYNITRITILVNFLKETIIDYFGDGSRWDVNITYLVEPRPLGTVGGIKELEAALTEDFIVLYGDVMINMHLGRLINFHYKKDSECTLVLHPNDHPYDSDLVEADRNHRVTRFYPKPHNPDTYYPNLVNAGAYIFSPRIMDFLQKGEKADFGRDIFPKIYNEVKMYGYNTAEYLKDMGTPERWKEVEADWGSRKISLSSYEHQQKAMFLDRDGVINEEISFIHKPEDLILYNFTSSAIRKINQSGYKAIVITNQSVIARNMCTLEELKVIHNKMETELGKNKAKLDAIYFCPHHPDKGFPEERSEYKIDCLCRKPKPGMLIEAAVDFNLDLSASFMIGDNGRDVEAGRNAGCATVGVRTGYAMKKIKCQPDFLFENLEEAVDYILKEPHKAIYEKIKGSLSKTPEVIAIGGNARSGKSTLASYLKWKFEREGKKVFKIELDNWILPEEKRNKCKNVYDRFRLNDIERDLQKILAGFGLNIRQNTYHPDREPISINYKYEGEDIILIEGVVALSSEIIRNLSQLKIFVEISKKEHYERIKKYYHWKNKTGDETEKIYAERTIDEYLLIEKDIKLADFTVNSTHE